MGTGDFHFKPIAEKCSCRLLPTPDR